MPLIHYEYRFASLVAVGTKRQTIRKTRKRPIKPGDRLIHGAWWGAPYRSKVRRLGESVCTTVSRIEIYESGETRINGRIVSSKRREALASADGFSSGEEMRRWFEKNHGLPFTGVLIRWDKLVPPT